MNNKTKEQQRESYRSLLSEYAAGTLGEALDVMVSSHLTISPQARKFVDDCEQIAGAMMEEMCKPSPLNEDSLLNVLNMIDNIEEETISTSNNITNDEFNVPAPLSQFISIHTEKSSWKKSITRIQYFNIPTENSQIVTRIVKLYAGQTTPRHHHNEIEYSLVLEGGFSDEYGSYEYGDLLIMEKGTIHRMIADKENGCTYLSITSCPASFSNPVYKILNIIHRY